jgi:hypothetical protein
MIVMSLLLGIAAYWYGYSAGFSVRIGIASMVLMQVGYFAGLLYLVRQEKKRGK